MSTWFYYPRHGVILERPLISTHHFRLFESNMLVQMSHVVLLFMLSRKLIQSKQMSAGKRVEQLSLIFK